MHIASIRIKNFRALKDVKIPLTRSTVIIGENNSGKSSVLDCVSLALGRRWGQRGTGFTDYDVTVLNEMSTDEVAMPENTPEGEVHNTTRQAVQAEEAEQEENRHENSPLETTIELFLQEEIPNEWPSEITTGLFGIMQPDPFDGRNSITLRVTYRFNPIEKSYEPGWAFIDIKGNPLGSREAKRASNTKNFFKYVPVYFLSALRDASEEFSSRSQFWGRILKAVEISPEERHALNEAITDLNARLFEADPRMAETVEHLKDIKSVVAYGAAQDVSIRALPMKVWEILARSEIVIRADADATWLPLGCQGQGVKSLSVIYLFKAFVERLLKENSKHSEPILVLEEPEVHLHPQAVRALWSEIDRLLGQKIIESHSPYFIQFAPLKDIRLLRRGPGGVKVFYIPDCITIELPNNESIVAFGAKYGDRFSYDDQRCVLSTSSPIDEDRYKELLKCYTMASEAEHHAAIRDFRNRSYSLLEAEDLEVLEDWARRIRGEIFFARFWLLCEGQSEIFLFTAMFDALGFKLDSHGVSLIDYQNNGSPRAFAALARTFGFQWILFTDGDEQGRNAHDSLKKADFSCDEMNKRAISLPDGTDLESYLVASPLRSVALEVAQEFEQDLDDGIADDDLAGILRTHKPIWTRRVGNKLLKNPPPIENLPEAFVRIREILIEEESGNDAASNS